MREGPLLPVFVPVSRAHDSLPRKQTEEPLASDLRQKWKPILAKLDEEELSCVINVAIERLRNDFGQPYGLTLDDNPSGTVQPTPSARIQRIEAKLMRRLSKAR